MSYCGFHYVPSWISLCPICLGSLDFTSFLAPRNQVKEIFYIKHNYLLHSMTYIVFLEEVYVLCGRSLCPLRKKSMSFAEEVYVLFVSEALILLAF